MDSTIGSESSDASGAPYGFLEIENFVSGGACRRGRLGAADSSENEGKCAYALVKWVCSALGVLALIPSLIGGCLEE